MLLTALKIIVGLATNSLGILSEAAHSALDLVAAAVTFWAVQVSSKPADQEHTYGHGKFENLSALFETLLLLVTCVWIVYEAVTRLFFREAVHVEATAWAFLVIVVSIVVDVSRSRALKRVAKKYSSQALEADALHFSTDVWSSGVVLLGLIGVWCSDRFGIAWLLNTDAVAALGVAVIVVWVSLKLGRKSLDDLLDRVPLELRTEVIEAVRDVSGVEEVTQVRIRRSGPEAFVDVTLKASRAAGFEQVHDITDRTERAIRQILPGADVVVHPEPMTRDDDELTTIVRTLAQRYGLGAHSIQIYERSGQQSLEFHFEVSDDLRLDEAHEKATKLEQALKEAVPGLTRIDTHIEPAGDAAATHHAEAVGQSQVQRAIAEFFAGTPIEARPHNIQVQQVEGLQTASFHLKLAASTKVTAAHNLAHRLEEHLRSQIPELSRVVIHVEPR